MRHRTVKLNDELGIEFFKKGMRVERGVSLERRNW